ncbi:MAG TPA: NAD(P)-binding protein [Mycobacteriales bacterium]|nr:NAD(P)-binding protein [Mycobacteriales bacterium]
MTQIETDYLVVGAGLAGMAFTDALVTHSDADVVLVDRRHRPGGHWNDAYQFVRLHLPSAYYGVNSRPLGNDTIDTTGDNAGLYERASGAEIVEYFQRVMDEQLLPSGQVRFRPLSDYAQSDSGAHVITSRLTGETCEVTVRRAVVDATYLESSVPATHTPSYDVASGVRHVAVNGLVDLTAPAASYVLVGAGKTAMDACVWLLRNGVPAERIRWIRPREAWMFDRAGLQPLDHNVSTFAGLAAELEALAAAESVDDLFLRLEAAGRVMRIDESTLPTMFRAPSVSRVEIEELRRVRDVVRLGRVVRIEREQVVLEEGSIAADPNALYVDCSARGVRLTEGVPIFEEGRIVVQQVRLGSPSFNSALLGFIESTDRTTEEKNRLCPPNPYSDVPADWLRMTAVTQQAARLWLREPDVADWVEGSRLNLIGGLMARAGEPETQAAFARYLAAVAPAGARLKELLAPA